MDSNFDDYPGDPYDDEFADQGRESHSPRTYSSLRRTGRTVKLQQIVAAHWSDEEMTNSYSIVGLGLSGEVYRYDARNSGWIPWSMEVLEPETTLEGKRRR